MWIKRIIILLCTFLAINGCSQNSTSNGTNSISELGSIELIANSTVLTAGTETGVTVRINNPPQQSNKTLELTVIGNENSGVTVSPSKLIFYVGQTEQEVIVKVPSSARNTPPSTPIEIIATGVGFAPSNPVDISIVSPGTISFTTNSIQTALGNDATAYLTWIGNDFNTVESVTVTLGTSSDDVTLSRSTCVFNIDNTSCPIIIKDDTNTGTYQVNAMQQTIRYIH